MSRHHHHLRHRSSCFCHWSNNIPSALSGFCVYVSMGIFIYFYAITFFLAWFSLNQRRVENSIDACICLMKENWTPNQPDISSVCCFGTALKDFGRHQILVGNFFDPNTFLDNGTYLCTSSNCGGIHFPEAGYTGQGSKTWTMERSNDLLEDMELLASPQKNTISPNSISTFGLRSPSNL